MTEVRANFIPLDDGVPAVLVETADSVHIALDSRHPEFALAALQELIAERFRSGAWRRLVSAAG